MSDTFKVNYSPEALEDLKEIYTYIAKDLLAPQTATTLIKHIRDNICSLGFMPARYVLVDWEPWHSMGVHRFPVNNFIVYYLIDNDQMSVSVARILYNGRDIENAINENK